MKPWSITTTVRNPERIRNFLSILKLLEGEIWDKKNQEKFQILLVQYKAYGSGENQFYKGLTLEQIAIIDSPNPSTFQEAKEILSTKDYVGGTDMRGRQSFNPLKKMGLAFVDSNKILRISAFGELFLGDDYDLGDIFFRSFLKWQLPNPETNDYKENEGYDIKPFIAILHLINEVNKICISKEIKPKGISKFEFMLFGLTLTNYKKINLHAQYIMQLRLECEQAENQTEINIIKGRYRSIFLS